MHTAWDNLGVMYTLCDRVDLARAAFDLSQSVDPTAAMQVDWR